MKRTLLALLPAFVFAVITYFTVEYLYTSGRLVIRVSDGQGHGPDVGSLEWQGAFRSAIPFRAALAGTAAGVVAFTTVFWSLRPARRREGGRTVDATRS